MRREQEDVGTMIRRARLRQGLSQFMLAKAINAPRSWIGAIETNQIDRPDVDRLRSIATVLRLPADNLLAAAGYKGATPVPNVIRPITDLVRELFSRLDEVEEIERVIREKQDTSDASGRARIAFRRARHGVFA